MFPTSVSLQSSRLTFLSARLQYRIHHNYLKLLKNQPQHPLAYQALGSLTSLLSVTRSPPAPHPHPHLPHPTPPRTHCCFKIEESRWTLLILHLKKPKLSLWSRRPEFGSRLYRLSCDPGYRVPHFSEPVFSLVRRWWSEHPPPRIFLRSPPKSSWPAS